MRLPKPASSTVADGLYYGMVQSVKTAQSRFGRPQIEITILLHTRDLIRVWVNVSVRGLALLESVGLATDEGDEMDVKDDGLVGVAVARGKATLMPASQIAAANPSLRPIWDKLSVRYAGMWR